MVLVQVERTGRNQQDAGLIHAETVKRRLIERLGVCEAEIAIKRAWIILDISSARWTLPDLITRKRTGT